MKPYYDNGKQSLYLCDPRDFIHPPINVWAHALITKPTPEALHGWSNEPLEHLFPVLTGTATLWLNVDTSYDDTKRLDNVPADIASALQYDWRFRSDIIVVYPNRLPNAAPDRPTHCYDHMLFFSRTQSYYYNAEAIAEPSTGNAHPRRKDLQPTPAQKRSGVTAIAAYEDKKTRNRRDVWTIPLDLDSDGDMPSRLVSLCILASTELDQTILDPWCGTGTSILTAKLLGRNAIGMNENEKELEKAVQRLESKDTSMLDLLHDHSKPQMSTSSEDWMED